MLQTQVSYYTNHSDRTGQAETLRDIIMSKSLNHIGTICKLRNLDPAAPDYEANKRAIKNTLPCFALNELFSRKEVINYSGLMQIDFDHADCKGYDIQELKQAVFSLPFVAFVSLSCSGNGFYALAAIAEPHRQAEYAKHIFSILNEYGITCDQSKGRNANDLRYVSYDANMLIKDKVDPLKISRFKAQSANLLPKQLTPQTKLNNANSAPLINTQAHNIAIAQVGQRWHTVQAAAYTLGGLNDPQAWEAIKNAIYNAPAFKGHEQKYIKCAHDCYNAGSTKPLT